jgi:hypothetical protein
MNFPYITDIGANKIKKYVELVFFMKQNGIMPDGRAKPKN